MQHSLPRQVARAQVARAGAIASQPRRRDPLVGVVGVRRGAPDVLGRQPLRGRRWRGPSNAAVFAAAAGRAAGRVQRAAAGGRDQRAAEARARPRLEAGAAADRGGRRGAAARGRAARLRDARVGVPAGGAGDGGAAGLQPRRALRQHGRFGGGAALLQGAATHVARVGRRRRRGARVQLHRRDAPARRRGGARRRPRRRRRPARRGDQVPHAAPRGRRRPGQVHSSLQRGSRAAGDG